MQRGFNSDVNIKGFKYHVQTEDWGTDNQIVITRVFLEGAVVKTVKKSYQDILANRPSLGTKDLQLALRDQHQSVIDQLSTGRL